MLTEDYKTRPHIRGLCQRSHSDFTQQSHMGSFYFLKLSLVCLDHGFLLALLKVRHFTFTVTPIESIEAGLVVSMSLVFVISCKPQRSIRKQNRPIFVRKLRVLFGF